MTGERPMMVDETEFNQLTHTPCVSINAAELCSAIVNAESIPASISSLKFFVLDCRSLDDYNCGHLPMSLHLDPALIDDARRVEELESKLTAITSMRGRHLCLVDENGEVSGQGGEQSPFVGWLSLILGRHLRYAAIVEGGYSACHAHILSLDRSSELIDHKPDLCLECNGRAANKREKRGLLASVRRFGVAFIRSQDSGEMNEETRRDSSAEFSEHSAYNQSAAPAADSDS